MTGAAELGGLGIPLREALVGDRVRWVPEEGLEPSSAVLCRPRFGT
jgi:hypothetical protein